MARMPGTTWKPITVNFTARTTAKRRVILHVAESESPSIHGWFNSPDARSSSHFYVARDGSIEQYVDTDHVSWASGEGNTDSISVETQGRAAGHWTPEQCDALARIIKWANETHGVPLRLMASSKSSEAGIGWHRLGVDGKWFPALPSMLAGRTQRGGGEKWSSVTGKSCPGDDRIPQIPGILEAAKGTGQTSNASGGGKRYTVTTAGLNRRVRPGLTASGGLHPIYGKEPLYKGAVWHGTGRVHKDATGTWVEGRSDWQIKAGQSAAWVNGTYLKEVK